MPSESSPAFQFYVKEWRSSRPVMRMTFAQRGMYLEMLLEQWENLTLPDDPIVMADLIGGTEAEWTKAWSMLRRNFVTLDGGRILNLRLEKERVKQRSGRKRASDKGKAGAAARWQANGTGIEQPSVEQSPEIAQGGNGNGFALAIAVPVPIATAVSDDAARAGRLLEQYQLWYSEERAGAKCRLLHNSLEFQDACSLVALWDDETLEKLARIVLTSDTDKFINTSDRGFKIFTMKATWAHDRLKAWEAKQARA